jgi:hypothetical protein
MSAFGRPLCTARPFADYRARFALTDADLARGPILDCPSGGSGLVLEARRLGIDVVGVDPLFAGGRAAAATRLIDDGETCLAAGYQDYGPDHADAMRDAMASFAGALLDRRPDPLVGAASLPHLPFPDATFSLVLSGHLLFTYRDLFTPADHVAWLRELVRVAAGPVRVFPVTTEAPADPTLDPNGPYPHLGQVLDALHDDGCTTTLTTPPAPEAARLGWRLLELRGPRC